MKDTRAESPTSMGLPPQWRGLCLSGAVAALAIVLFCVAQIVVFVLSPPPETVTDWFMLFQRNWFVGLLDFDLLYILDNILMIFVYLAFYGALREKSQPLMILSTTLGLVAIAIYVPSNNAFSMLSLSRHYSVAATEAERSIAMAAGQTMVSLFSGTSYIVFTVLGSVAPIIISVAVLKYGVFSKTTAWMGIVGNVLPFGLFLPEVGKYLGLLSVPFLIAWFILTALRLLRVYGGRGRAAA
jgi:hypothetical protein